MELNSVLKFQTEVGVSAMTFSPDGRRLLIADNDGRIVQVDYRWDVSFEVGYNHHASVRCIRFSPNGRQILIVGERPECIILNVNDWITRTIIHTGEEFLNCGAWISDDIFAIGGSAGIIRKYDLLGRQQSAKPFAKPIMAIDIDHEGRLFASSYDGRILEWFGEQCLSSAPLNMALWGFKIINGQAYGGGDDGRIHTREGPLPHVYQSGAISAVVGLADGVFASMSHDGTLLVFTPQEIIGSISPVYPGWTECLATTRDRQIIAFVETDGNRVRVLSQSSVVSLAKNSSSIAPSPDIALTPLPKSPRMDRISRKCDVNASVIHSEPNQSRERSILSNGFIDLRQTTSAEIALAAQLVWDQKAILTNPGVVFTLPFITESRDYERGWLRQQIAGRPCVSLSKLCVSAIQVGLFDTVAVHNCYYVLHSSNGRSARFAWCGDFILVDTSGSYELDGILLTLLAEVDLSDADEGHECPTIQESAPSPSIKGLSVLPMEDWLTFCPPPGELAHVPTIRDRILLTRRFFWQIVRTHSRTSTMKKVFLINTSIQNTFANEIEGFVRVLGYQLVQTGNESFSFDPEIDRLFIILFDDMTSPAWLNRQAGKRFSRFIGYHRNPLRQRWIPILFGMNGPLDTLVPPSLRGFDRLTVGSSCRSQLLLQLMVALSEDRARL